MFGDDRGSFVVCLFLLVLGGSLLHAAELPGLQRRDLRDGWLIQSSCKVPEKGGLVSTTKFVPKGWHPASVPATVLAALVADKVYPDPYHGMNLRAIPGTSYPIGKVFSQLPMPDDSPYRCSWWYRTEFHVPREHRGQSIRLHFGGINYRASIWINGRQIASSSEVAGTYRTYEFDVSQALEFGKQNVLAVEVSAPTEKDLAINWVDWNPAPPDKDMGLWREVYLTFAGPVVLRNPQVVSHVDAATLASAELTLSAEMENTTGQPVQGTLVAEFPHVRVQQAVELGPNESKLVTFDPAQFPELRLRNPQLWWPYQMGTPHLQTLEMKFVSGNRLSDRLAVRFGIREVTSEMTEQGHRLFRINGKKILIRGGGWAPDMLLRASRQQLRREMRYVRDMNLNAIRLEGKLESDDFYDLADEYGILIMPGWCCCDIWERWKDWPPENLGIATESLKSQVLRMRNHPSIFVWLNGSDNPPPAEVEKAYLDVLQQYHWPNPVISSATAEETTVSGKTGVKMTGPYDWIPPSYWLLDSKHGGAYGFNTETGPGPAIPPAESLRRFLPREHLWPIGDQWNYHAGGGGFTNLDVFRDAMAARYLQPTSMEQFADWAQVMAYEGERAMFEAYSRNKYNTTGVIQWMLNNAWPSLIWHLYDYYLMPAGGYFGTKKACEPLHALFSYPDHSVYVVNSTYQPVSGLRLSAMVYNLDLTRKFAAETTLDIPEDTSQQAFVIPEISDLSTTYFVKLDLRDHAGKVVSSNFYWLSTKPDAFDWDKTDYRRTPVTQHGDLTALSTLPKLRLQLSSRLEKHAETAVAHVKVKNPSKHLAFQVRLRLLNEAQGADILPVFWGDNFFALMPGEEREVTGTYDLGDSPEGTPVVRVEGVNVIPQTIKASGGER